MKKTCPVVIGFLLLPSLLFAQTQGRVKGIVKDKQDKPIAKATITITCPDITNYNRVLVTDNKGAYSTIISDATKRYKFKVEAAGFQSQEPLIKPLIGAQTLEKDFILASIEELQNQAQQQALEQPGIKQLREGADLLEAGKKSEARAKFEEAVKAKPELYLGWYEIARMDLEDGKAAEALTGVEKCLSTQPGFAPCLALGMNAAQAKGDKATFETYQTAYRSANPTDPTIYFNEAVTYLNKYDDAKAKPLLEQALSVDPKYPDALYHLGMVFFRLGETAKAKEMLTRFLEVAPSHKEAPTATEMLKYM